MNAFFFLDCTSQFFTRYPLGHHLKSHTQEKVSACPNCGTMFSTYIKLKDHCRQSNKGKCQKCYSNYQILTNSHFQIKVINVRYVKKHSHVNDF